MKQQIDNNINTMIRVEESRRNGLNSHMKTRSIIDESKACRPVVGIQRVIGYSGEQEPNTEHDNSKVVGLLCLGNAALRYGRQI